MIFEQESATLEKKVVLIVDDDLDLLSLNRTVLEMGDFKVFTAQSGQEALTVLSQISQPDLILLDMQMDDMSGTDFLAALEEKRPEIIKAVPVVFLTAMDKVPASQAMGFIRKPINIDKFLAAVHRFIAMGTVRPPAGQSAPFIS